MTTQKSFEIPVPDPQDTLVDKGAVNSYTDARAELGIEAPIDDFGADAIINRQRAKAGREAAHLLHVELYHVPEDPSQPDLTDEQRANIEQSKADARASIRH